jgi:hypothetical protein
LVILKTLWPESLHRLDFKLNYKEVGLIRSNWLERSKDNLKFWKQHDLISKQKIKTPFFFFLSWYWGGDMSVLLGLTCQTDVLDSKPDWVQ